MDTNKLDEAMAEIALRQLVDNIDLPDSVVIASFHATKHLTATLSMPLVVLAVKNAGNAKFIDSSNAVIGTLRDRGLARIDYIGVLVHLLQKALDQAANDFEKTLDK